MKNRKASIAAEVLLAALFVIQPAHAAMTLFRWNASPDAVAGYKLHQGTVSGKYTSSVTLPGAGTEGAMDLDPTASRYVAATAYDDNNLESDYSNEILCHPVIVSGAAGGTVSPGGTFFVQDGKIIEFMLTPLKGYRIKALVVNGVSVGNVSTHSLPVGTRTTVTAEFEAIPPPNPPTELHLQVLNQIAADVSRIAAAVAPEGESR